MTIPLHKLTRNAYVELDSIFQDVSVQPEIPAEITLDFADVPWVDSLTIGVLLKLLLHVKRRGSMLKLVNLSTHLRTVLHHSNLDDLLGLPRPQLPRWDNETKAD